MPPYLYFSSDTNMNITECRLRIGDADEKTIGTETFQFHVSG